MKKIKIIRHGKPEDPYTDYTKLSFEQFCGLATEKLNPGIHFDNEKIVLEKIKNKEIDIGIDLIMCSFSKRTIQTAQLIKKLGNINVPIVNSHNLSEIYFDPAQLTTKDKFNLYGLPEIRKSLMKGIFDKSSGTENLLEIEQRINNLERELIALEAKNILCVCHSFYMRFLRLFLLKEIPCSEITLEKVMETIDDHFLEGFYI